MDSVATAQNLKADDVIGLPGSLLGRVLRSTKLANGNVQLDLATVDGAITLRKRPSAVFEIVFA